MAVRAWMFGPNPMTSKVKAVEGTVDTVRDRFGRDANGKGRRFA